eukprot:10671177-Alexandrium_andersonii.AAC.1
MPCQGLQPYRLPARVWPLGCGYGARSAPGRPRPWPLVGRGAHPGGGRWASLEVRPSIGPAAYGR